MMMMISLSYNVMASIHWAYCAPKVHQALCVLACTSPRAWYRYLSWVQKQSFLPQVLAWGHITSETEISPDTSDFEAQSSKYQAISMTSFLIPFLFVFEPAELNCLPDLNPWASDNLQSWYWVTSTRFTLYALCSFSFKSLTFETKTICFHLVVVVQLLSRVRLCDPMDCSMPGFPVLHYLPNFVQTHVHWISDAIQPSCPLSFPSPPALNLC